MIPTAPQLELAALRALTAFPFLLAEVGLERADFQLPPHQAYFDALRTTAYYLANGAASPLEVGERAGWSREAVLREMGVTYQIVAQARDVVRDLRASSLALRFSEEMLQVMRRTGPTSERIRQAYDLTREYSAALAAGSSGVTNMHAVTLAYLAEQQQRLRNGVSAALSTGIWSLDRAMRGWRSGELTTLVAAGGAGKSTLAEFWRRKLAEQRVYSLKFAGEMTEEQEGERTAHAECGVPMGSELDNVMELTFAQQAIEKSDLLRFLLLDARGRMDPGYVRSVIAAQKGEVGELGLVVIDHLRHLQVEAADHSDYAVVSTAVQEAKRVAKDCGVPVLLLTHTNRRADEAMVAAAKAKGAGADPDPSMIRGSGRIFEESDNVLCLWRPDQVATLYVWKARQTGAKGRKIPLEYDVRTQVYKEL